MREEELVRKHPVLFHMTRAGAWPTIEQYGLLSTKAICMISSLTDAETQRYTAVHRPTSIELGQFVLRDQKPLRQHNLKRNLEGSGLSIEDWHKLLSERVFFFAELRFLNDLRKAYLDIPVTILKVDTKVLLDTHRGDIELSSKNSGAARMPNHWKSRDTFQSIEAFNFELNGKPKEVTVKDAVRNVSRMNIELTHLAAGENLS